LYPAKNKLELCVIDNGVGFNVNEGRKKTSGSDGIGLSGLYKRAYQIGAELNIQSKIGQGTTVKIELPLAS
jgi:signal transduction histidine kinase